MLLGDPRSPLRFVHPWVPPPPLDLAATSAALRIVARAGWITAAEGELPRGLVRLSMEPAHDHLARMQLTVRDPAGAPEFVLATCGDHGLPIRWEAMA